MTQLSIQIPDELKSFVDEVVLHGEYPSESEFITSLLYSMKAESESALSGDDAAKLQHLCAALSVGVEQLRNGESAELDANDIITRGRARWATNFATHG